MSSTQEVLVELAGEEAARLNQDTRECPECQEFQRQFNAGERTLFDIEDHLFMCFKHLTQAENGCPWDPRAVGIARGLAQSAGVCVFVNEHGFPDCESDWLAVEKIATGKATLRSRSYVASTSADDARQALQQASRHQGPRQGFGRLAFRGGHRRSRGGGKGDV